MKVSLAEMAADSKKVLDQVVLNQETAEVQNQGKTIATISPGVGVSREELIRRMNCVLFTKEEQAELKKAMAEGAKALTDAGSA